jgi:hypothetical protein
MLNVFPAQPDPDRLGQIIGRNAQGHLLAELHHAVEPQFLEFFVVQDDARTGRRQRIYLTQVVDIGYSRQAGNDSNFDVYTFRRNLNPDVPLSNDDQAIIAKNVIALRLLGCIEQAQIMESFTLPGILAFVRRPRPDEYEVLAASPLATAIS